VRTILQLSGWTLGFVAANQLAVFVILALEFHTGPGGVSAYTYAYTFFQLPFGVVAVSVVNVATPQLARAHTLGRPRELGARFGTAARQVLALVLPAAVGYLVLARPIISLVIDHGAEVAQGGAPARTTAATLAMFALGLPAFCLYLLAIRAFQAMQDTRTAFILYVLENATNILVALILYRTYLGVRGLALSYSIAYSVAALAALAARATGHDRRTGPVASGIALGRAEPAHGGRRGARRRGRRRRQRGARLGTPAARRRHRRARLPWRRRLRGLGASLADFPLARPGVDLGGAPSPWHATGHGAARGGRPIPGGDPAPGGDAAARGDADRLGQAARGAVRYGEVRGRIGKEGVRQWQHRPWRSSPTAAATFPLSSPPRTASRSCRSTSGSARPDRR
jgi:hypothetical protein